MTTESPYEKSDFGRVFGWWLCLNTERIADVNYWFFDASTQFWHEYKVFPFNQKFDAIGYDPDLWCSEGISLESRFAEGYYTSDFVMNHIKGNLVSIRNAFVPKDVFTAARSYIK